MNNLKPSKQELLFLEKAYNSFYDSYEKITTQKNISSEEKFNIISKIFSIYSECLKYEPIGYYKLHIKQSRPEWETIALNFFEIIRHIITHFPFFNNWNEVSFNRDLILWNWKHSKIDSFLKENEGKDGFKWRVWDWINKTMKYWYTINFPKKYNNNDVIFLKDLIDEDLWIDFSLIMIKQVLDSQIENNNS